jgi:dUTPase
MVFCPVAQVQWELVSHLSPSERNEGGFGHTGT